MEIPGNKVPKSVKTVTEDFARGVSQYINRTYEIKYPVSNGYMKLWEIYANVAGMIPNNKDVRIFHIAEAPGQWINCTSNYIVTKRQKVENYDWRAMSLNHKHPKNIEKYGKGIFKDDYGFIKKYPEKWLYGADNTGDFTRVKNIMWYRDYVKKWCGTGKLHLITGDAGMNSPTVSLRDLQMIDYAQVAMVAACGTVGTNCVTKHFLPYIRSIPKSYYGSGFFVNYIYVYYLLFEDLRLIKPHCSNPDSGEFYVVGLKKRNISDEDTRAIVEKLNTFKTNNCFFPENKIPENFKIQVIEFINKILKMTAEQYDIQNMLMTCIVDNDPIIEKETQCKKYLSPSFTKEVQETRFKEWVKINKFEQ